MTIKKFIKECASLDTPIGDVARDAYDDSSFPWEKSEQEIIDYWQSVTKEGGTNDAFQEFLSEYKNRLNTKTDYNPRL